MSPIPPLDPQLQPALDRVVPLMGDMYGDVARTRKMMESYPIPADPTETALLEISDLHIPGPDGAPEVLVRRYRPRSSGPDTALPTILYLHGGGFTTGSINTEHAASTHLAAHLGVQVISVDYRLAPEHPFPAAVEDCFAALRWVAAQPGVDTDRIAAHGTSAGGHLATSVAIVAKERGGPRLCFQSMVVPATAGPNHTTWSRTHFTETPLLDTEQVEKAQALYLPKDLDIDAVAPLDVADLTGLPPAYISVCELDPVRDEGIEYAIRLMQAGVNVELHSWPGTFHGANMFPGTEVTDRMIAEIDATLKRALLG